MLSRPFKHSGGARIALTQTTKQNSLVLWVRATSALEVFELDSEYYELISICHLMSIPGRADMLKVTGNEGYGISHETSLGIWYLVTNHVCTRISGICSDRCVDTSGSLMVE